MADHIEWAQCDRCAKWRVVPTNSDLPETWYCELNPNEKFNSCSLPEEILDNQSSPSSRPQAQPPTTTSLAPNEAPPQPSLRRQRSINQDQEIINLLKSWPIEQLREFWQSIDWSEAVQQQMPKVDIGPRPEFSFKLDDDEFVADLQQKINQQLPEQLRSQSVPWTSLRKQQELARESWRKAHQTIRRNEQ